MWPVTGSVAGHGRAGNRPSGAAGVLRWCMLSPVDGEHDQPAAEEQDPPVLAARPGRSGTTEVTATVGRSATDLEGAVDLPQDHNVADGDDEEDEEEEEEDVVTPLRGRHTGASLLLGLVGMILIPAGLIVVLLAFTGGDRVQNQSRNTLTAQTLTPGSSVPTLDSLAGRWVIVGGADSWVGYSAGEKLLNVDTPTNAEGRTTTVDGGIVLSAGGLQALAINAKLSDLKSDDPKRDQALRTFGLETDKCPNASFSVTDPIAIGKLPPLGQPLELTVKGDLTLHGVTKPVEFKAQVQILAGSPLVIEVVANQPITFADFGIKPTTTPNLLSVQDHGELRIHLRLARVPDDVAGAHPKGTGPNAAPGSVPDPTIASCTVPNPTSATTAP